jgi:hypothetical protein
MLGSGAEPKTSARLIADSLTELAAKYKTSEELKEARRKITELRDPIAVLEVPGGRYSGAPLNYDACAR